MIVVNLLSAVVKVDAYQEVSATQEESKPLIIANTALSVCHGAAGKVHVLMLLDA